MERREDRNKISKWLLFREFERTASRKRELNSENIKERNTFKYNFK
jgi:hypothetical protein